MRLSLVTFVRPYIRGKKTLGEEGEQRAWLEFTSKGVAEFIVVDSGKVVPKFPSLEPRTPGSPWVWVILAYQELRPFQLIFDVYQRAGATKGREKFLVFHALPPGTLQRALDNCSGRPGNYDLVMDNTTVLEIELSEEGGPLGPKKKDPRRNHLRLVPRGSPSSGGGGAA